MGWDEKETYSIVLEDAHRLLLRLLLLLLLLLFIIYHHDLIIGIDPLILLVTPLVVLSVLVLTLILSIDILGSGTLIIGLRSRLRGCLRGRS